MRYFKQVPFLQILFFFTTGIITAEYFKYWIMNFNTIHLFIVSILSLSLIILFLIKKQLLFQIIISLIFFIAGFENYILQSELTKSNHFSKYQFSNSDYFIGRIKTIKKTRKGTSLVLKISHGKRNKSLIALSGNLLIYTDILYDTCTLSKNDLLKVPTKHFKISKNQNPLAFNPEKYYHFQNIHYYSYSKAGELILLAKNTSKVSSSFRNIKSGIVNNLKYAISDKQTKDISIAIMLGEKQDLDKNILQKFSLTGIRHILTVSGMHVGIIALILNFLLSLTKFQNKYLIIGKIIIIISGIWFYTFISGAEPAVLRAAFMISLIMLGINLRRYINIFNILFSSAFIILLFNPFQLFKLSFILSYSAMLSILMFYKPIYSFIEIKKIKVLDYFWQLISLALAAQVLILPLSVYYFHTGPSLFFITALISTPMAFATMILGFSTSFLYFLFPCIGKLSGELLQIVISGSLKFIDEVSKISINLGDYFYLNTTDTLLIILIILTIYLHFYLKIQYTKIIASLLLLIFLTIQINKTYRDSKNEFIVYATNRGLVADFFIENKVYSYQSNTIEKQYINYIASNYRYFKGYYRKTQNSESETNFIKKENIIQFSGKIIVALGGNKNFVPTRKNKIDYLLIEGNINPDTLDIFNKFRINTLILTKNLNYNIKKNWSTLAKKFNIEIWDISSKGAFISEIKTEKDV